MKSSLARSFALRVVRRATSAAAGASVLFAAHAAFAGETKIGAGVMGIVGGNFLDKPDRTAFDPDFNPGFGGLTAGLGLMLDARFLNGLLGVEGDVIRSSDKGHGSVTFNGYKVTATIGQAAWHVPLLAKLTLPSPLLGPSIFIGPEFVFPSKAETSTDPSLVQSQFHATVDNYIAITGGLGLEIKVPLPVLDLRIPLGLRGSYTPSVSSKYADRTKVDTLNASITYRSEWKFAVNFTAGAALYF